MFGGRGFFRGDRRLREQRIGIPVFQIDADFGALRRRSGVSGGNRCFRRRFPVAAGNFYIIVRHLFLLNWVGMLVLIALRC